MNAAASKNDFTSPEKLWTRAHDIQLLLIFLSLTPCALLFKSWGFFAKEDKTKKIQLKRGIPELVTQDLRLSLLARIMSLERANISAMLRCASTCAM